MKFKELNIIEPILKALEKEEYEVPTPIQQQAIPPLLQGRDILGCAQTGERVIIVTGCINALRSRVSGTLVNMIHALLRVIKYNYCKQCMRSKDVLALQY